MISLNLMCSYVTCSDSTECEDTTQWEKGMYQMCRSVACHKSKSTECWWNHIKTWGEHTKYCTERNPSSR